MIDPNFFGDPDDLETMVAGFKTTRRLMETPALRALQKKDMFTEGVRTDDDIRAVLRARVDTVYHPVGTAKMGVNDPMAVVDPKLKVYGLEGLRVVDASDHADPDRRQHQCADHHDRREGGGHDQGGDAGELIFARRHCRNLSCRMPLAKVSRKLMPAARQSMNKSFDSRKDGWPAATLTHHAPPYAMPQPPLRMVSLLTSNSQNRWPHR